MRPPTPFERLADPEGRRRSADPRLTANRAAQFMPFAALTGYYELVRKQEITVEPKCELTEEKALELSHKLEGLKRGDLVRVTYYDTYGYRSRTGILDEVLPAFKLLKLRDIAIDFGDIQGIELRGRA
ncbi:hypothetical protein GT516_00345 [Collinsella sp. BIOML-A4]|nr:hypothetical protein [Collinsella sp. BIOML-A2]MZJ28376.1 hypothetical protein [Collinsella sp. BIOML-A3]MZJ32174.1 hypothetical protein [Collinsella sp. BIOML-A1]MZJ95886.1 hypothetical protein [Collinsella sp. BIOML-A6]MZK29774.1 hypothetical protein [Collinsella sp. BIOML-A5]MZK65192.1 hypothetical protein [Collinsella sp. BIOML-A4]